MADASSYILPSLSNFDIRNTLPGLQHDFLTLWDEIDREAVPTKIRDSLRNLYNALNPGTDDTSTTSPASNTKLNSYNHPSDSTFPTHEAINENSHTLIATSLPVSHRGAGLATVTHPPAHGATEDTNDTSVPNPTPQSGFNGGAAPQCNEGVTIVAPAMVPGPLSSPTLMPVPSSSALTGAPHSPPDSGEKGRSYALPHASVRSSYREFLFSHVVTQVASSLDPNVTTTAPVPLLGAVIPQRNDNDDDEDICVPITSSAKAVDKRPFVEDPDFPVAYDNTQDPNILTRPQLPRYHRQSEPLASFTVATTLSSENRSPSENTT
ncbi:hypothetical protein BJV78DRAFT_412207 [Lactifluus subvellereus]|nr:hypothetical protein BJV78DRAFT_412207 [Lactifluus subvellereus]